MLKQWALGLPLFILTACANADGTVGQVGSVAWLESATTTQRINHYTGLCIGYGFKEGTTAMAQCVQKEAGQADAAVRGYYQSSQPQQTTCARLGNTMNCTSF